MDWLDLLHQIFEVAIIPVLGVLVTFLVQYINIKKEEILIKCESELGDKYINLLAETINNCVIATNQTYVESLKAQGKFDIEAQKEAFAKTQDAVLAILSDDAKEYLENMIGDLTLYIAQQIEAQVNINK